VGQGSGVVKLCCAGQGGTARGDDITPVAEVPQFSKTGPDLSDRNGPFSPPPLLPLSLVFSVSPSSYPSLPRLLCLSLLLSLSPSSYPSLSPPSLSLPPSRALFLQPRCLCHGMSLPLWQPVAAYVTKGRGARLALTVAGEARRGEARGGPGGGEAAQAPPSQSPSHVSSSHPSSSPLTVTPVSETLTPVPGSHSDQVRASRAWASSRPLRAESVSHPGRAAPVGMTRSHSGWHSCK
jgi:hypothetical protein